MTDSDVWRALVEMRRDVLQRGVTWPAVDVESFGGIHENLATLSRRLVQRADRQGVAVFDNEHPLSSEELVKLGSLMGVPIKEHDDAVKPYCENDFVLNLRTVADSGDTALQPFSHDELLAHTEGSLRPPAQRPRWIVLQCLAASDSDAESQTIAVSMRDVANRLSQQQLTTLRRTFRIGSSHPVVVGEPPVFALRDPSVSNDRFDSPDGEAVSEAAVLAAMMGVYEPRSVKRIPWRRGVIAVIDNSRVFHARTSGRVQGTRHLQRIRVGVRQ